ncbi:MAG: murein L,D-transpeptidase catalytic domain family protein [Rudaea sp.]|uniref:murein L,D-transpeptidase catalytic domain-containing protein n=1 Tax=unclassified Rudaea TaxID=2627037 RepID=UPI0014858712|nr:MULTISPECIES: murein L,D-transpeptidase catalytic domain family protein [unclassified Rudaea]MBN8884473.1 murein L,D-transpeptidase catalytic domain family protein [Rudaea sp.]
MLDLTHAAPAMSPAVAERAQAAYECHASEEGRATRRLIVVDMSLPSSRQRLWAFDLSDPENPTVIVKSKVAHGSGSDPKDDGMPSKFGNLLDSGMTSLGLYRIAERFANAEGRRAYSLDGLDVGFNDAARARHVVFHPSSYVQERSYGHPGRSLGCPAVDPGVFDRLDKSGVEGALMWIDGPDPALGNAPSLSCGIQVRPPQPAVCTAPDWFELRGGRQPNMEQATWQLLAAS